MISFLSENEESDIKYLSCFCVYDVQNADLCLHKDLYLEKVHHLAVKQDGTQAEQEKPEQSAACSIITTQPASETL